MLKWDTHTTGQAIPPSWIFGAILAHASLINEWPKQGTLRSALVTGHSWVAVWPPAPQFLLEPPSWVVQSLLWPDPQAPALREPICLSAVLSLRTALVTGAPRLPGLSLANVSHFLSCFCPVCPL